MDRVVHFEIPADDVSRARGFYGKVFGWKVNSIPNMGYTIFHTGPTNEKDQMLEDKGFINGGMMERQGEIKGPVITINVEDIDAALDRIAKEGGSTVSPKIEVPEMGWSAYFRDTEGNVMGLWQNKTEQQKT